MSIVDDNGGLVGPDGQPLKSEEEMNQDYQDVASDQESEMEVNFFNYITSLGFQAMIFLGEIPSPVTNQKEKNLKQAKFLIDTLGLLEEKTAGNLTEQESSILKGSLYELRMKYVAVTKDP